MIDLHVHSTHSDGTLTPAELVAYAVSRHLSAFALTDHDTVSGLCEAFEASRNLPVEVISGIEFSSEYQGKDIHIVGLDFDWHDSRFCSELARFQDSRSERNRKMTEKLAAAGISISMEQLKTQFGDAVLTRAHFARFLYEHGYVSSMKEAFSRYLGDHAPCFVPREKVTPQMAVRLIHQTGGIAVLAHPMQYHLSDMQLKDLVSALIPEGLNGIEAMYSTHSQAQENKIRHIARAMGIAVSGGSDFHGSNKPDIELGIGYGNLHIPDTTLENLRKHRDTKLL